MSTIIDSHVHHYPPEVMADPAGWAQRQGETRWAAAVSPPGKSIQGWADMRRLLADMDAAGVEMAVLQGWYWQRHETCVLQNQWHRQWLKEVPERFAAFATVQPLAGERAFDDVRRAVEEGCAGIGEILPAAQDFAMQDHIWLKICAWAQDHNIPVCLHVTEPVGHNYKGRIETNLDDYLWLAAQFPALHLILSHWGGGLPFYELNPKVAKVLRNVYYDTAASPLLCEPRVWRAACQMAGAERILFGSDYPLLLYPREEKEPGMVRLVEEVRTSGVTSSELAGILGGNARKLLNLPAP